MLEKCVIFLCLAAILCAYRPFCCVLFICARLDYIINAPTCFGASAPSSGIPYIVFAKVIKY